MLYPPQQEKWLHRNFFSAILPVMEKTLFDRGVLRAYIADHRLSEPAMAAHAGISRETLRGVLAKGKEPRAATRAAIERALELPPPRRRNGRYLPEGEMRRHEATIREFWYTETATQIARRCGVTQQCVSGVAKAIGLPLRREMRRQVTFKAAE